MIISKIDGAKCKNLNGLSLNCYKNGITLFEYFLKYEGLIIPKCPSCNNDRKFMAFVGGKPEFRHTCGSQSCIKSMCKKRTYTEEQRSKARKKRFEYLSKRTGKTAWERKSKGELSYLEKWFQEQVIEKYNLSDKFDIVYNYPVYPYFLDFSFLNINLDVELDGRCHFVNGIKRVEHDIKRDKILVEKGWKVYRIKFDEITQKTINEFILFLNNIENVLPKVYGNNLYRYREIKKQKETRSRKEYGKDVRKKNDETEEKYINLVLGSNIDFSKYGWHSQVAAIIKRINVRRWMKRHLPDIYENNCFKRNPPKKTKEPIIKVKPSSTAIIKRKISNNHGIEIHKKRIALILNSGMDFTESNWGAEARKIIGMSRSGFYQWIRKHMPYLIQYIPDKNHAYKNIKTINTDIKNWKVMLKTSY